jgi:hypothetical protein
MGEARKRSTSSGSSSVNMPPILWAKEPHVKRPRDLDDVDPQPGGAHPPGGVMVSGGVLDRDGLRKRG